MCVNKCNVCSCLVAVTAVTVGADNVALTIPTQVFNNKQKLCFFISQTIASSTLPVVITNGADTIQLLTPCGNAVRADQLRSRRVYHAYVATDTSIAIIRDALCCTAYVAPQITGVAEVGA